MNDQEINRAVAEASGWIPDPKNSGNVFYKYWTKGSQRMVDPCPKHEDTGTPCNIWPTILMPDYCNDLNAMHEVESRMTDDEHLRFRNTLWLLIMRTTKFPHHVSRQVHSATARQRAEAVLCAIGKWRDA